MAPHTSTDAQVLNCSSALNYCYYTALVVVGICVCSRKYHYQSLGDRLLKVYKEDSLFLFPRAIHESKVACLAVSVGALVASAQGWSS